MPRQTKGFLPTTKLFVTTHALQRWRERIGPADAQAKDIETLWRFSVPVGGKMKRKAALFFFPKDRIKRLAKWERLRWEPEVLITMGKMATVVFLTKSERAGEFKLISVATREQIEDHSNKVKGYVMTKKNKPVDITAVMTDVCRKVVVLAEATGNCGICCGENDEHETACPYPNALEVLQALGIYQESD